MNQLNKASKEPLLHFFILGLLIFVFYSWGSKHLPQNKEQIIVSLGKIENLSQFQLPYRWDSNQFED